MRRFAEGTMRSIQCCSWWMLSIVDYCWLMLLIIVDWCYWLLLIDVDCCLLMLIEVSKCMVLFQFCLKKAPPFAIAGWMLVNAPDVLPQHHHFMFLPTRDTRWRYFHNRHISVSIIVLLSLRKNCEYHQNSQIDLFELFPCPIVEGKRHHLQNIT